MSSREGHQWSETPVYTINPGVPVHGHENYGFQANHPQGPPPKYEDVMSGKGADQQSPLPPYGGGHQQEVILVAPAYKYSFAQRTLGRIFIVVFMVIFFSILAKVLSLT